MFTACLFSEGVVLSSSPSDRPPFNAVMDETARTLMRNPDLSFVGRVVHTALEVAYDIHLEPDANGFPSLMWCPDPRYWTVHKLWLSRRSCRDPQRKSGIDSRPT
jgi:hypothetical protein